MNNLATEQSVPRSFPISVELYRLMAKQGAFGPDDRVELIDGEIKQMSPIGNRHARVVDFLNDFLTGIPKRDFIVRVQNSIVLDDFSQPQPDITLVKRREDFYRYALPSANDVLLAVEVADSTVFFDRSVKFPKYGEFLIPEAWLIDLNSERVEVHSLPENGGYGKVRVFARGEILSSNVVPGLNLLVDDILG